MDGDRSSVADIRHLWRGDELMLRFVNRWFKGRLLAAAPLLLLLMQGHGAGVDPNSLAVPAPFVAADPTPNYFPDWNNPQGKAQVDCATQPGEARETWVVLGQSNTTATANGLHYPINPGVENVNLSDGGCYRAKSGGPIDPLLGATGYPPGLSIPYPTGSWVGVLADLRISAGKATRETMMPIGVGGSYIKDWEPGGANNIRIGVAARRLAAIGISAPTGVLIGQGESDLYTPGSTYQASLQNTINSIHSYWPNVNIYVAIETYINGLTSPAVRAAQMAVINPANHVFQGPDGDMLGDMYRYDRIHFSYSPGCTTWASRWQAVLP